MKKHWLFGLLLIVICTPIVARAFESTPQSATVSRVVAGGLAQNDGRTPGTRARLAARDAVWYNNPDELAALLDAGLDVNAPDETSRETLLHTAAWRDRLAIAQLLLERGADRTVRDKDGKRPVDYASSPEMRTLLGPAAPARPARPSRPAAATAGDHCQRMWREATALCGLGATSCNTSAHIRYQQCQKTGTWY